MYMIKDLPDLAGGIFQFKSVENQGPVLQKVNIKSEIRFFSSMFINLSMLNVFICCVFKKFLRNTKSKTAS